MAEIIAASISAATGILVAIVTGMFARERSKTKADKERMERRAAERAEESRLSMGMLAANGAVTMVIAKKVLDMHTNGDVKQALDEFAKTQKEYNEFQQRVVARQVAKV